MRCNTFLTACALPCLAAAAGDGGTIISRYVIEDIEITDLGTLGGNHSGGYDINDNGDIAGSAEDGTGKRHAMAFIDGVMYSLHDGTPAWEDGYASGINNDRVVVGGYKDPATGASRPFYYYPGIWLEPMAGDAAYGFGFTYSTAAYAINSSHQIVGFAYVHGNPPIPGGGPSVCYDAMPLWWLSAGYYPTRLFCVADANGDGQYGGEGLMPAAYDINDSGDIVGTDGRTTPNSMFLWKAGQIIPVPPPVSPLPSGRMGRANGINNRGWVVGEYGLYPDGFGGSGTRAFVWDGVSTSSQDLGLMSGGDDAAAYEINEQNMVVGWAERIYVHRDGNKSSRNHGFLWHKDFGMYQLKGLGTHSYTGNTFIYDDCGAYALNNRKSSGLVQVTGTCRINGTTHAVRWDIIVTVQTTNLNP